MDERLSASQFAASLQPPERLVQVLAIGPDQTNDTLCALSGSVSLDDRCRGTDVLARVPALTWRMNLVRQPQRAGRCGLSWRTSSQPPHQKLARKGQRLNQLVAISVALLATFMGVCKVKDDNIVQAMQQAQANKLDHWNFYQARNIREEVARSTVVQLPLTAQGRPGRTSVTTMRPTSGMTSSTCWMPPWPSPSRCSPLQR